MKAITTKYIPYTATKPSRIKAFDNCGNSVTRSISSLEYVTRDEDAHEKVAKELCKKMGWNYPIIGGWQAEGIMVWVFVPKSLEKK